MTLREKEGKREEINILRDMAERNILGGYE